MIKDEITLRITNQADAPVPIQLFGSPQSTLNNRINNLLVQWDLSTEDFSGTNLTFQYGFIINNLNTNPNSIKDVVNALNTLDIGVFYSVGTTIYCVDIVDVTMRSGIISIL